MEYADPDVDWKWHMLDNPHFPCNEWSIAFYCYYQMFSQRSVIGVAALKHLYTLMDPAQFCQTSRMLSEMQVRSCIGALSHSAFVFYHAAWTDGMNGITSQTSLKACMNTTHTKVGMTTTLWQSHYFCSLFTRSGWLPKITTSSSLIRWCSIFVSTSAQRALTRETAQRWLMCILMGASKLSNGLS